MYYSGLLMLINAFVFCHPGETERAATYCHSTLQRQLKLNQFNPMEWALNAATLSQYYITKVNWDQFKTLNLDIITQNVSVASFPLDAIHFP